MGKNNYTPTPQERLLIAQAKYLEALELESMQRTANMILEQEKEYRDALWHIKVIMNHEDMPILSDAIMKEPWKRDKKDY